MGGTDGYKRTCKGLFSEFTNQLQLPDPNGPADALRCRQGITAYLTAGCKSIGLPGE